MHDYNGRIVYLGIDVHKKTYSVTAISDGLILKADTLKASPTQLLTYCGKHFAGAELYSCYEAGFSGFNLHRTLVDGGISNIVVHAASIEIEARNRVKNDKRDSKKMAIQLSQGRLRGIHIPAQEREDMRSVSRLRMVAMKERVRAGNRLKSFLYLQGLIPHDANYRVSEKWLKELSAKKYEANVGFTIQAYIKMWRQFAGTITEINERLKVQAFDEQELEDIYTSLPGIGPTSARALINELGDMAHFPNENNLFSYLGLTPSEHSSGEHRRLGHISRQGKPSLRKILVVCAWVAIRKDLSLKAVFDRLQPKTGGKKAIVAIARKLSGRLLSCLKAKRKYKTVTEQGELVVQNSIEVDELCLQTAVEMEIEAPIDYLS